MPYTEVQKAAIRRKLARQRSVKVDGVQSPLSVEASYYRKLRRIISRLITLTRKELLSVLEDKEDQYVRDASITDIVQSIILGLSRQMADIEGISTSYALKMANDTEVFNRRKFVSDINKAIGINLSSIIRQENAQALINRRVAENVALIKTLPAEYFEKLESSVLQGLSRGDDYFSIRRDVEVLFESTDYRAKRIARDQVTKLNAALTEHRQRTAGVTHYIWRTSMDDRVRDSHEDNANQRFAWDSAPSKTGHPGHDVQCRCYAEPDLSHLLDLAG